MMEWSCISELHEALTALERLHIVFGEHEPFSALFIDAFNPFLAKALVPVFLNTFRVICRNEMFKRGTIGGLICNFGYAPIWCSRAANFVGSLGIYEIYVAIFC